MAFEEVVKVISLDAKVDLSGDNGSTDGRDRFVVLTTDTPAMIDLAGANAVAVGVLTSNPIAGAAGRVAIGGIVPVLVGAGGVTAGQLVSAGADGVAIGTGGTKPLGTALATVPAGGRVSVLLDLPLE